MRTHTLLSVLFLFVILALTGCGPTLVHTPKGWRVDGASYVIEADPTGRVMPAGWVLSNYDVAGDGFRKDSTDDKRDLAFKRKEDDGLLVLAVERLTEESEEKKLEVIAERWVQRVVVNPADGEDPVFEGIAPPLVTTTHVESMLRSATGETLHGRNVDVSRRLAFEVPNGSGFELEANLVPNGAPGPDRTLYLSVLRRTAGGNVVVIAYANTPSMFAAGLVDATSLAHRVRF